MILEGQERMRTLLLNIDKNMLELSGRVERLAVIGGSPQITGQAQVSFLPSKIFYFSTICFSRVRLVVHRMFLLMLHELKISIE